MSAVTIGQAEPVEGYQPFFGLREAPFGLDPDPRFLFASASHSAALAQVGYAIERREPLVVITGEIGTGKTLLCRTVLQQPRRKTFLSLITDPRLERDDLLKQLLADFGVISKDRTRLTETSRHELIVALQAFLRSLAPIQAHAVVIIDEAQHLLPDVLEQIRLVSNIDDEHGTLLEIILVGQADLEALLSRPELRQLQQRVSRRVLVEPLNRDEVKPYIKHRLALARDGKPPDDLLDGKDLERELADWAGTNGGVDFTPDAIQAVSQVSRGVPRAINLLCHRSLEEACASKLRIVDRPLILTAAQALGMGEAVPPAGLDATVASVPSAPDEAFWADTRRIPETSDETAQPADEPPAVVLSAPARPAAAPQLTRYLVLATAFILAAVAIWFAVRSSQSAAAPPPPAAAAAAPAARPPIARPEPPPAAGNPSAPNAAAPVGTPTPPASTPAPARPAAPAAASNGAHFDIVVASFRTEARAASVAAEVTALGVPMRRRVLDGWQQVVAGPFASRADAEQAQQRLQRAGLTGTQIVSIAQ
jgi:general secretion pathway protein A